MLGKLFNLTAGGSAGGAPSAHGQTPSSASKPIASLESVQEDIHTRNLLFPDAQSLYQHRHDQVFPLSSGSPLASTSTANAFDYDGDIDLDSRDVRILIMQDALSSVPAAPLYDSQTPPPVPTPTAERPSTMAGFATVGLGLQDARRQPVSPRKASIGQTASRPVVIQPGSPQPRHGQGAFDRRASTSGRSQPLRVESESQRASREYFEELGVFSSCIFGNSELMAYKGTSTKVHVVPSDPRADLGGSIIGDGRGSLGRASMRSSKLSQSFSSEAVADLMPQISAAAIPNRLSDRKKVLITRLFPVAVPSTDDAPYPSVTPQSRISEDGSGFPFPYSGDDSKTKKKKPTPKQKRVPMYAVALIINLPQVSPQQHTAASASRQSFRGPGSYTDQDSFPSSYGSVRRSGWTMVGQGLGGGFDPLDSSYHVDSEDRFDPITQHWDIIMRTLTHLQSVVATKLGGMLRYADVASPDPMPLSVTSQVSRHPSLSRRRSDDGIASKPKSNARLLTLPHNCLMDNGEVRNEVEIAKGRIVAGLRATRVVTGQNRWGIWREEARWVAKWAGGREQGFFFYTLLTGYLATHTDWLQALGPWSYRRRHLQQQRARGEEDTLLPARTVIVANDKMAARRLVFLLSAFLPANQQLQSVRTHRPSTSTSFGAGAFSHSPPSYVVPILKEESLRRKINRRAAPRRTSHSRNTSLPGQAGRPSSGVPAYMAHLSMERGHERRSSDAASIRTANLPISVSDVGVRKSSAATTITQEATVPHFSTMQKEESYHSSRRPGSSSSVAADDLKRTLQRGDSGSSSAMSQSGGTAGVSSGGSGSRPSSTWGVLAGLWSARRRGSVDISTQKRNSFSSRETAPIFSPTKATFRNRARPSVGTALDEQDDGDDDGDAAVAARARARALAQARERAKVETDNTGGAAPQRVTQPGGVRSATARVPTGGEEMNTPQSNAENAGREPVAHPRASATFQRPPAPAGAFESPVKTSINSADGVIDVDVPFPDYITSFETAVSSPSSSGYLSTPGGSGLEAFEHLSRLAAAEGDVPFSVAGWLQCYHPDFVLQAIPPQHDLLDQVKASLRAEPSPPATGPMWTSMSTEPQHERWLDVSSAIIADATTFSITRIRYRRLVRPKPAFSHAPDRTSSLAGFVPTSTLQSPGAGLGPTASSVVTSSGIACAPVTPAIAPYETKLEEEFIMEPLVTLDEVLVEAVERVLGHGVAPSSVDGAAPTNASAAAPPAAPASAGAAKECVDSASSSRSHSKRRRNSVADPATGPLLVDVSPHHATSTLTPAIDAAAAAAAVAAVAAVAAATSTIPEMSREVPRAECKTVILSALEEVVRDVVEMRERETREGDDGHRERESDLRLAVRAWLESVDMGD